MAPRRGGTCISVLHQFTGPEYRGRTVTAWLLARSRVSILQKVMPDELQRSTCMLATPILGRYCTAQ